MTQFYILLVINSSVAAWCAFWSFNEDFNLAQRWTYGLASLLLASLSLLGIVQGAVGE